jgi:hypothetical protein
LTAKKAFIVFCITVAILIVLEVLSRIILSRIYNREFDSSLIVVHKYGPSSGLKANASGMVWGKPFHTDEMGGRKQAKKKKGKLKLLVIGDSVTEGVGVEDSSTFINLATTGWDDWEIRNISLIGWSSADYRNVIDHLVVKDCEIKNVCLFYCLNDIYGKNSVKDLPAVANKGFISMINAFLQSRYATYKLIKLLFYQSSDHYYQYDQAFYNDSNKVKAVMDDLVHIKKVCDRNKVIFTIYILPYRSQLADRNNSLPQKVLATKFGENNIMFFDLLKELPNKSEYKDWYLFGDEIHLSAMGHRAVADAIFHK